MILKNCKRYFVLLYFFTGDTWIILNRKLKLLPGGIVQIQRAEDIFIECQDIYSERLQLHYPRWKSSSPVSAVVTCELFFLLYRIWR